MAETLNPPPRSLAPYNHVEDPVIRCKIFVRGFWWADMVLSTLLGIFPINYTKFLDFLAGKIFGPKVLNFDVIALKLAH